MHTAAETHSSALIVDTHADTPQRMLDEGWEFTDPLGHGHLNLASARAGNLAAEFFAIWPEPSAWAGRFAHRTLTLIDAVLEQLRRHPADLALALCPADILAARISGGFAVLMGIEGGHAIENSLALLRLYHRLGVRYMTLTWANSNDWAGSSGDEGAGRGLSPFGREVVAEMNALGMMVDVSHVSDATLTDVLAVTRAPVLASHSNARALCDSSRNLTDAQLRAIAGTGGAIMVNVYSGFVDETYRRAALAQKAARNAAHGELAVQYAVRGEPIPFHAANAIDRRFAAELPRPPLASLIAHFEHILEVAGEDHVGLGTDFDGMSSTPEGLDSAADLPRVTEALLSRGHSAQVLHKLLGGNLMRVFGEVQAAAQYRASATIAL